MDALSAPASVVAAAAVMDVIVVVIMRGHGSARFAFRAHGNLAVAVHHAENVSLLEDQIVLLCYLHLGAGPFGIDNAVAGLDREARQAAILAAMAGTDRHYLAFQRLLLCSVGQEDAAFGHRFFRED